MRLFRARGEERQRVFAAADRLRREVCGDEVSYVVTRNIQYTNVCYFRCGFCAFSKGRLAANLRGAPYLVPLEEIVRRAREAWERGATEVCLQGGIHPAFTGDYYASVVEAIRSELPELHIHAFSALEVWQGAATLGLPLEDYLARLRALGLGSLPGTAAEILDDEVRAVICPDKVDDRAVARRARGRAPRRAALERDDHVRPRRAAGALGAPSAAGARAAAALRRLHRVRAAAVRAHGGADVAAGPGAVGADVRRVAAPARGRAARAPSGDHEHPGVVGEARAGGRGGCAARGRERPRRDADERVDLALGRIRARPGDAAGGDGGADPRERPRSAPAHDALRGRAGRAAGGLVRRRAARRAAESARARGGPEGAAAARRPGCSRALGDVARVAAVGKIGTKNSRR